MKKLFAFLLALTMVVTLSACGGESTPDSKNDGKDDASQETNDEKQSGWFSDKVLKEMKLSDFKKPAKFDLLTDEELPDASEDDPYIRALKGASSHDEYYPLIDEVFKMLQQNYGEVYEASVDFGADGLVTNYVLMPEVMYGTDFYVKDGETIRSIDFGLSSYNNVDTKVLEIRFSPKIEE